MKGLICAMFFLLFCHTAYAAQNDRPWQLSLTANYGDWRSSDVENHGTQTQGLVQIAYQTDRWGIATTARQVGTSYKTTLQDDLLSISTLTDVNIATYYAYIREKWIFRGGIDFDLPTGKSAYSNDELGKIILDPIASDLMILSSYGRGFNIAPHFAAIYQFDDQASWGAGIRYQVNGKYDFTSDSPGDTIDPGDRLLLTSNATYGFTERDIVSAMAVLSQTGNDTQNGNDSYQTGESLLFSGRYLRIWSETLQTILGVLYVTQANNRILDENGVLTVENQNANNNYSETYFQSIYALAPKVTLLGMVGVKQVAANEYDRTKILYDGGRRLLYIEPGVLYLFSKNMYMTAKLRLSRINDKADGFSRVDATYSVINADLAFVMSF